MDDPHTKEITRNLKFIKERLCDDVDTIVDGLIEKDIFNMTIKDKLDSAKTPKDKTDTMIRIIINKGQRAIDAFKSLLRKNNYEDVLKKMAAVEVKGCDSSAESDVYNRDPAFIGSSFTEKTTLCVEVEEGQNSRREMHIQSLEVETMHREDCPESKYSLLQNAYKGARNQVAAQREKLYKVNQEKIAFQKKYEEVKNENKSLLEIEKKYEKVKNENKSLLDENKSLRDENKSLCDEKKLLLDENATLKSTVTELNSKVQKLEVNGAEKDSIIVEMQGNIQGLKQKRKKDRDRQKRFEDEVRKDLKDRERSEKETMNQLTEMAKVVQNLADKSNNTQVPKKSENSGKRQFIVSGLNSNKSYNSHLNKTKNNGKQK